MMANEHYLQIPFRRRAVVSDIDDDEPEPSAAHSNGDGMAKLKFTPYRTMLRWIISAALLSSMLLLSIHLILLSGSVLSKSDFTIQSVNEDSPSMKTTSDKSSGRMLSLPENEVDIDESTGISMLQAPLQSHIDYQTRKFLDVELFFRGQKVRSADDIESASITIATQFTVNPTKLQRLVDLASRWDGYLSVSIYFRGDGSERKDVEMFISEHSKLFSRTTILFVTDERKDGPGIFYPINILRNLAMDHAPTKSLLVLDVDNLPSRNAHSELMSHLSSVTSEQQVAFILPSFERRLDEGEDEAYPADMLNLPSRKVDLLRMMKTEKGKYSPWKLPRYFAAHGPTNFEKWYSATETYQVEHSLKFNPYFVIKHGSRRAPPFWEFFDGYGYNRHSWVTELSFAGYTFTVVPDCFLIHINHSFKGQAARSHRPEIIEEYAFRFHKYLKDKYDKYMTHSSMAKLPWKDLPSMAREAAVLLGYDAKAWNNDESVSLQSKHIFSADEVEAIHFLGLQKYFPLLPKGDEEPRQHDIQGREILTTNLQVGLADELREKFGIEQYRVYRKETSGNAKLPLVMLVHHREIFVGCHSFERFFNPKWETIVVVEEDMENQYQLKQLAGVASSPAIHLALLNNNDMTGEWLGRQVALHIMNFEHEHAKKPLASLILSTQCDIHPLPTFHALHKPYEVTVQRMVHLFLEEDRLNQESKQRTNINEYKHAWKAGPLNRTLCQRVHKNKDRPLLALNTVMVETLPSTETLEGSIFHSKEAGLRNAWSETYHKNIPNGPWMSDISTWVEDHFTLYNVTLLSKIVDDFARVQATLSAGVKALPHLMCKNGWKAARLNDEPMFYDLAKPQHESIGGTPETSHSLFDASKYGAVSFEWLLRRSVLSLVKINSPLNCLREYMGLRTHANIDVKIACVIGPHHFQPDHLPKGIWSNTIERNKDLITAIMQLHGYEPLRTDGDDAFTFVRAPIWHSVDHATFLANLEQGTDGIASGGFRNNTLRYIELPRNGTMKENSIFAGHYLRAEHPGASGLRQSSFDAERICALLGELTTIPLGKEDSRQFTATQISHTFDVMKGVCPPSFDWHLHAPLTGFSDALENRKSRWKSLPEKGKAAASLLGFDERTWDEDASIPLYEKSLDDLSEAEQRSAVLLGLERMFSSTNLDDAQKTWHRKG